MEQLGWHYNAIWNIGNTNGKGIVMGFTMILLLVYLALLIIDVGAFIYGSKKKKWILFVLITAIMILGILLLGYLWFTSPM